MLILRKEAEVGLAALIPEEELSGRDLKVNSPRATGPCSADWQSAVSPIGNRRMVEEREAGCQPAIQPTASRRYRRYICACIFSLRVV